MTIKLTGFKYARVEAEANISVDREGGYGIVSVYTGGCSVQAYATVKELRDLAHALTVAADTLEIKHEEA